jgi:type 2A phosphatase activator TIP41
MDANYNPAMQSQAIGEEVKEPSAQYPLHRVPHEKVKYVNYRGWEFIFVNDGGIANSLEQVAIQTYLKGVQAVPDMTYAFNRLFIVNREQDFLYQFSPLDAL